MSLITDPFTGKARSQGYMEQVSTRYRDFVFKKDDKGDSRPYSESSPEAMDDPFQTGKERLTIPVPLKIFNTMSVGELKCCPNKGFVGIVVDPISRVRRKFELCKDIERGTTIQYTLYLFLITERKYDEKTYVRRGDNSKAVWKDEEELIAAFRAKKYYIST